MVVLELRINVEGLGWNVESPNLVIRGYANGNMVLMPTRQEKAKAGASAGFIQRGKNQVSKNKMRVIFARVAAKRIMDLLDIYTPYDTGKLWRSIKTRETSYGAIIKAEAEYATYVHEITDNYHEFPTKAKFLEDACIEVAAEMFVMQGVYIPISMSYKPLEAYIGKAEDGRTGGDLF